MSMHVYKQLKKYNAEIPQEDGSDKNELVDETQNILMVIYAYMYDFNLHINIYIYIIYM